MRQNIREEIPLATNHTHTYRHTISHLKDYNISNVSISILLAKIELMRGGHSFFFEEESE